MTTDANKRPLPNSAAMSPSMAARALLSKHWNGQLPVDPLAIARAEGIKVEKLGLFEDFPYSGEYLRLEKLIRINEWEAPVRQRFTLAHELGHYALGHDNAPRDTPESFSSRAKNPKEREANQFAAELLMPSAAVDNLVTSGLYKSVDDLAKAFNVSKVAMTYRINNLNLGLFI